MQRRMSEQHQRDDDTHRRSHRGTFPTRGERAPRAAGGVNDPLQQEPNPSTRHASWGAEPVVDWSKIPPVSRDLVKPSDFGLESFPTEAPSPAVPAAPLGMEPLLVPQHQQPSQTFAAAAPTNLFNSTSSNSVVPPVANILAPAALQALSQLFLQQQSQLVSPRHPMAPPPPQPPDPPQQQPDPPQQQPNPPQQQPLVWNVAHAPSTSTVQPVSQSAPASLSSSSPFDAFLRHLQSPTSARTSPPAREASETNPEADRAASLLHQLQSAFQRAASASSLAAGTSTPVPRPPADEPTTTPMSTSRTTKATLYPRRASADIGQPPTAASTTWTYPVAAEDDKDKVSEFQSLLRQQLEYFLAGAEDAESTAQGRRKTIALGQIGLRCRHCAHVALRKRQRGAVYYPTKLDGVYQAAQNMATSHVMDSCLWIPDDLKERLQQLKHNKSFQAPPVGGKRYWAEACQAMGFYESDNGLRLSDGAKARLMVSTSDKSASSM